MIGSLRPCSWPLAATRFAFQSGVKHQPTRWFGGEKDGVSLLCSSHLGQEPSAVLQVISESFLADSHCEVVPPEDTFPSLPAEDRIELSDAGQQRHLGDSC